MSKQAKSAPATLSGLPMVIGGLLLGLVTVASAGEITLRVPEQDRARLTFPIESEQSAEVVFEQGAVRVVVGASAPQLIVDQAQAFQGEIVITIADYNFDDRLDLAVLESYGYGGVNQFNAVYVFDPVRNGFRHWLTASNIRIDAKRRELLTGEKSGPRYFTTLYRVHEGEPYPYRESVLIGLDLEKVTLRDVQGQPVETRIVDLQQEDSVPAVRTIAAERAYFHAQPEDSAKTKTYIIRGDQVELLDSAGDWDEWFLVRYRGKRIFERWIKAEVISE